MSDAKTKPTNQDVLDFLATLEDKQQQRDSERLVEMMSDISAQSPVMWGTSIVGFGQFTYKYASGREGDWMRIGFAPRKGMLSLYVTYDASQYREELASIGKHTIGKGCIYIKRLADVDIDALRRLIEVAYRRGPDGQAQ